MLLFSFLHDIENGHGNALFVFLSFRDLTPVCVRECVRACVRAVRPSIRKSREYLSPYCNV